MAKFTYKFKFSYQTTDEVESVGDYILFDSEKELSSTELADVWHNRLFEVPQGHYFNFRSI